MNTNETLSGSADPELDSLYAAITGRRAFSYNAAEDPLYRAAADRMIQNGRLAMRDTVGRAAALTGGYGSSYAQAVGQQQYDEYLRSLSQALPQYYSLAWQRYEAEGKARQDAYALARQREQDAYGRQRDAAAAQAAAEAREYARRQDSYKQLYQLILNAGYQPTDGELAASGMTRDQAEALRAQYLKGQKTRVKVRYVTKKQKKTETQPEAESVPEAASFASSGSGSGGGRLSGGEGRDDRFRVLD